MTFLCTKFSKIFFLSAFVLNLTFSITFAQPTGFIDEMVSNDWNFPVGMTFDNTGRMYVWQKGGLVYKVENGVKNVLIDINEEVLNFNDHGLNGFALDPNYLSNGYVYLMYAAKRYYVLNYGTPEYDPNVNANEPFKTTIGRIVRYTVDFSSGSPVVDYNSRLVLVGETLSTGIPILVDNHGVGSLVFGSDGTLLATAGDGAFITDPVDDETQNSWFQETVSAGILTTDQLVGPYRSQRLDILNGKLMRLDPATGNGISSNPFYDSNNPRSPQSRIWTYGLRNPFRFSVKPNTGSTNPADGNPGILYVGDVGWSHREELDIIDAGGRNGGWPAYEGLNHSNPMFQDPNYLPVNHHKPLMDWRGPIAQAEVNGDIYSIGSPQFMGDNFTGISSIGGVFYTGTNFPTEYQNTYFHGDYEGWIKSVHINSTTQNIHLENFGNNIHPVCMAVNPVDGSLYYVNFFFAPIVNEIRKITYDPNANQTPIANFTATPVYGSNPLTVTYDATLSSDPENTTLTYEWDFGNSIVEPNSTVIRTYTYDVGTTNPVAMYAKLKVTDAGGKTATKSVLITVNNSPPIIASTTIDSTNNFCNNAALNLSLDAAVSDLEQSETQLTYQWIVSLKHDNHSHVQTIINAKQGSATLGIVPQDGQTYAYHISLKVTDPLGLTTIFEKDITPILTVGSNTLTLTDPTDMITSGAMVVKLANQQIDATNTIQTNANVTYQAGKSITLNPGFSVAQGSVFVTKIQAGCSN